MPSGLSHAIAEERGVCGAQRRNEAEPCTEPRAGCRKHCGAKLRSREGNPPLVCSQRPMPNGRCRMHKGKALAGHEHPNFVHGRDMKASYKVAFSEESLEAYERHLKDPDRLALTEEMAAVHALALRELERAKVGEGNTLWLDARAAWRRFDRAQRSGQAGRAASALTEVGELLEEGGKRAAGQRDFVEYAERLRRLSETERRRLMEGQQILTAQQALTFTAQLTGIVRRRVTETIGGSPEERMILDGIGADVARLVASDMGEHHSGV